MILGWRNILTGVRICESMRQGQIGAGHYLPLTFKSILYFICTMQVIIHIGHFCLGGQVLNLMGYWDNRCLVGLLR